MSDWGSESRMAGNLAIPLMPKRTLPRVAPLLLVFLLLAAPVLAGLDGGGGGMYCDVSKLAGAGRCGGAGNCCPQPLSLHTC
eukprot:3124628-Amphidinium_carterae.2